jgi:hypothetical protein
LILYVSREFDLPFLFARTNTKKLTIVKNQLLKTPILFLFAVVQLSSIFAGRAFALGGFSETCYDTTISDSILTSTCYEADGSTPNTSSIDLNEFIENVDGTLTWQPDNFFETCRNLELVESSILIAECKTRNQSWVETEIYLDEHIANINGVLTYE